MNNLILNPVSQSDIETFLTNPSHALLITAPQGMGKGVAALHIASRVLDLPMEKLDSYPYLRVVEAEDGRSIGIEAIRSLEHFVSLKIPGQRRLARVVIIAGAHLMTVEAQNAFLKALEEPPLDTLLILTAASPQGLLPTIRSRVQTLSLKQPQLSDLKSYFAAQGYSHAAIEKALLMSGGLPGLMHALLTEADDHPLVQAVTTSRQILQSGLFERLLMVDSLSKQKAQLLDVLFVLGQMAQVSLTTPAAGSKQANLQKWQGVLRSTYRAREAIMQNCQPKLVLIDFMLGL